MHDEVSETEHIRANLAIERSIAEGCDVLLDVNQVLCRQGKETERMSTALNGRKKCFSQIYLFLLSCFSLYECIRSYSESLSTEFRRSMYKMCTM